MVRTAMFLLAIIAANTGNMLFSQAQANDEMRGAVIRFERFGGFAGLYSRFWIFADGRILDDEGKQTRIPVKTVESLLTRIHAVNVPADRKPSVCMDCFRYRITVSESSVPRSFVVDEDALFKPDRGSRIANDLRNLLMKRTDSQAIGID